MKLQISYRLLPALLVIGGIGCGSHTDADFIPSEDNAREALQAALDAWKAGKRQQQFESGSANVQPSDVRWREGQKLRGYRILKEEVVDGPRQFKVQLHLEQATDEPVETVIRYYVAGINPLWVTCEEDYISAGMDAPRED
jgi:hypothetical protein